jgi:hypothetical protein
MNPEHATRVSLPPVKLPTRLPHLARSPTFDVQVASLGRKLGHPEWMEARRVGLRLSPITSEPVRE